MSKKVSEQGYFILELNLKCVKQDIGFNLESKTFMWIYLSKSKDLKKTQNNF